MTKIIKVAILVLGSIYFMFAHTFPLLKNAGIDSTSEFIMAAVIVVVTAGIPIFLGIRMIVKVPMKII